MSDMGIFFYWNMISVFDCHTICDFKGKYFSSRASNKAPVTHTLQPVGDLLATKISGDRREVAGWLQGGQRQVADRLHKVAGTIWSEGGFGCCKWNLSATKSIVERFLLVADRLPTGRQLVGDWSPTSCSGCRQSRQFLVADWSPTSRRSVADRFPKSCRVSAIKNKRSRYSRQPVADRSPIGCRSLPNWSPTDCWLIADGSTITVRLHDIII